MPNRGSHQWNAKNPRVHDRLWGVTPAKRGDEGNPPDRHVRSAERPHKVPLSSQGVVPPDRSGQPPSFGGQARSLSVIGCLLMCSSRDGALWGPGDGCTRGDGRQVGIGYRGTLAGRQSVRLVGRSCQCEARPHKVPCSDRPSLLPPGQVPLNWSLPFCSRALTPTVSRWVRSVSPSKPGLPRVIPHCDRGRVGPSGSGWWIERLGRR